MQEYSRILIEEYCTEHAKTKKAAFLREMVTMSYDVASEPTEWQIMHLERLIAQERNPELLQALQELDNFLIGA